MATSLMQLCGLVALVYYHIPSTSAKCQNSYEYNRTLLFVPKNGTAAFVCNVTTGHEAQLNVNKSYWWPGMNVINSFGIHPQYVEPNSTIGVEVKGNSALNKTSIVCYCYDHNSSLQDPVDTFETTILIYDRPSPPTNLTVTRIVGTSVNISWRAPFTPSGVALWYHVMIADVSGTRILTLYQTNTPNYETNCSQCEIKVVAVNEAGESIPVMFNLTNETPSPSPSEEPTLQTLTTQSTTLVPPLLVCVIMALVGGFVIVVLIVIAFVAAVRCRRTRRLKIPAPKTAAGPTDFQRDSGDTPALSSAYQAPRV